MNVLSVNFSKSNILIRFTKHEPSSIKGYRILPVVSKVVVQYNSGLQNSLKQHKLAISNLLEQINQNHINTAFGTVLIRVQGFNKHRDLFLIGLSKLKIAQIQDVRPLPLNGCRKPAKRRL